MKKNYELYDGYRAQLKDAYYKSVSQQERRAAVRDAEYVRPKRRKNNLVDSYDDILPSRFTVTSWKDKTKNRKQWEK